MVEIKFLDGTEEIIETVKSGCSISSHFAYDKDCEMFLVIDHEEPEDWMRVPREFVKSIRHIGV